MVEPIVLQQVVANLQWTSSLASPPGAWKDDTVHTIKAFVQKNIIDPAIKGTINLLRSCLNSNSVKRVVFTSSISTITAKDSNGKWKPFVDECCQIQTNNVCNTKASGWVCALSKLLTEEATFKFAKENDIDKTSTVAGPFFTANVPSSVKVLLSPLTDSMSAYSIAILMEIVDNRYSIDLGWSNYT
ncbi:putative anthocyanidin reductase [Lotus japonicus]|uniref:putative anthocyanidin reductase n=1 Tax=Lotus japonicus TaxID=34305 RepID=UPI00258AF775|nr:putative anthocyanidin reductase [Lotus japonicus]